MMIIKLVRNMLRRKRMTAHELYLTHGKLTKQNVTQEQLIKGAERQYNRFCNPDFQSKEMRRRLDELIPTK